MEKTIEAIERLVIAVNRNEAVIGKKLTALEAATEELALTMDRVYNNINS